jgi:hypothetical protein
MKKHLEYGIETTIQLIIPIAVAAIILLILTGCGEKTETVYIEQEVQCEVSKDIYGNGVIECENGMSLIVPPSIIVNETIIQVPVYIKVPKNCKNKE